ncbi:phytanoyl-CoA dioxygenase [Aureococcus anophagefferens]|nr:phytanoyl-CoA dioxygenase [Aureococcus anophagefferens]
MDTTSLALEVRALRAELAEVRANKGASEGQQAQPVWFARGAPWELLLVVVLCNIYWHDWANAYVDDKLGLRRVELRGSSSTIDPAPLVLAQDPGLKSGINQRNMIQHPAVQFLMLWGGAFSLTSYRSEAMVSVLFYS